MNAPEAKSQGEDESTLRLKEELSDWIDAHSQLKARVAELEDQLRREREANHELRCGANVAVEIERHRIQLIAQVAQLQATQESLRSEINTYRLAYHGNREETAHWFQKCAQLQATISQLQSENDLLSTEATKRLRERALGAKFLGEMECDLNAALNERDTLLASITGKPEEPKS